MKKKKLLFSLLVVVAMSCLLSTPALAAATSLEESAFAVGLMRLLSDGSKWITGLALIGGGVALGLIQLKKMQSEDQEYPQLNKQMKGVVVAVVIALSASAIMGVVSYYFKP